MKDLSELAILCAAFGVDIGEIAHKRKHPRPIKQCLNCGEDHDHNNSFCSARCCKEYRG